MPLSWKPKPREVLIGWIDTLINEEQEQLTSWELKFVGDMENILMNSWNWTETQERKLEQIYTEKIEIIKENE